MGARIRLLLALGLLAISLTSCGNTSRGAVTANEFRPEVKRALVDGTPIAYYRRGDGPSLLMLIGSHSTMSEWDPALLGELARNRTLIMFDYPGIGFSGGHTDPSLTIGRLANKTADFIAALGLDRVDVLGWSMGGMIAQQLAIRHPQIVNKLILAGTNPGGDQAVLGPPRHNEIEDDPHASEAEQLETLFPASRRGRAAARAFLRRVDRAARSGEVPDDFEVSGRAFDAQTDAEIRWLRSDRNYLDLTTIQAPTLVTGGNRDVLTPAANGRRIAKRIPGASLVDFKRGGHAFLFQFHERFGRLVDRFLVSVATPAAE